MRPKCQTESIAHITRNNMQMGMKYLLPRSLAVREPDIYSFTLDPALTQRGGKTLRDAKHPRAFFLTQLRKVTGMSIGDYERVSRIDGLNIHKSRTAIILINHADFQPARQYLAKYAVIRLIHRIRPLQPENQNQNTGSANFASAAAEAFSTSA